MEACERTKGGGTLWRPTVLAQSPSMPRLPAFPALSLSFPICTQRRRAAWEAQGTWLKAQVTMKETHAP